MLLTTSLETLLGNRRLGLFVVDEAHTVTSWGKDFRADYWFLGDYLERQRRNGLHFPVLCLTATAVYGGQDDVVQDTIDTLKLNNPILYLGRVRRDNINFDIHPLEKTVEGSRDEFTITVSRSYTPRASDVITRNSGSIYEIRMGDLWEKYFSDMTFGMFKVKFFNGELFAQDGTNRISVRVKTTIRYAQDFETTRAKLRQYMEAVARVFDGYRKASHMFTVEEFCRDAQEALGGEVLGRDFAKALLELFVMDVKIDPTKRDSDRMKFIQARQQGSNKIGMSYRVMNGNYFSCANWMDERLVNCTPNREENEYLGYLPATIGGKQNPVMRLLAVLEIFGLASYEVRGGQNLEIFVRVNDPQKIRSLSEDRRYKNQQLAEIHRRHADAEEMMTAFLTSDLTTKQRWDLIEDYFLGHDEVVAQVLGLKEEN